MCDSGWVSHEFSKAPIRDKRLVDRLVTTTKLLSEYSHASIPQSCGSIANMVGAYRFFSNKNIKPEVILMSHRQQTIERMRSHETILVVQDTTSLDFSGHKATEGLGLYSDSQIAKGMLLHSALAVTTDGKPLGILSEHFWSREPKNPQRDHQKLPIQNKESLRWLNTLDESLEGIPSDIKAITVCDREGDIYDLFHKAISEKRDLLVRAARDRIISNGVNKKLFSEMESCIPAGEVIVTIPRNANLNSPEREARLSIKHCPITIKPPKNRSAAECLSNLNLYAVLVEEVTLPPKGVKSIYWLLLTTLPVNSAEEAYEKVLWYKQRWKIERYHYALKSGCKIEELQLETADRLQNAIAVYSVIAWRLLWLTYESRENPNSSCEIILQKHEWQALYCFVNKTRQLPKIAPTMHEALVLIAKLGGFLARKRDGEPGVNVLWRGMSRLRDISESWLIFSFPNSPSNLCND